MRLNITRSSFIGTEPQPATHHIRAFSFVPCSIAGSLGPRVSSYTKWRFAYTNSMVCVYTDTDSPVISLLPACRGYLPLLYWSLVACSLCLMFSCVESKPVYCSWAAAGLHLLSSAALLPLHSCVSHIYLKREASYNVHSFISLCLYWLLNWLEGVMLSMNSSAELNTFASKLRVFSDRKQWALPTPSLKKILSIVILRLCTITIELDFLVFIYIIFPKTEFHLLIFWIS